MKKFISVVVLAILSACGGAATSDGKHTEVPPIDVPVGGHLALASIFAPILGCVPANIKLDIVEQTKDPNSWNSVVDGHIDSNGVFYAPVCGSRFVVNGTPLTVRAVCTDNGNSASQVINTPQDIYTDLALDFTVVEECGDPACIAGTPSKITPKLCARNKPATKLTNFYKLTATCGDIYTPTLPDILPEMCQSRISAQPAGTCTKVDYNDWGPCQKDNTQTRTIKNVNPNGCTPNPTYTFRYCEYGPLPI